MLRALLPTETATLAEFRKDIEDYLAAVDFVREYLHL
jgi:hypothetical protein